MSPPSSFTFIPDHFLRTVDADGGKCLMFRFYSVSTARGNAPRCERSGCRSSSCALLSGSGDVWPVMFEPATRGVEFARIDPLAQSRSALGTRCSILENAEAESSMATRRRIDFAMARCFLNRLQSCHPAKFTDGCGIDPVRRRSVSGSNSFWPAMSGWETPPWFLYRLFFDLVHTFERINKEGRADREAPRFTYTTKKPRRATAVRIITIARVQCSTGSKYFSRHYRFRSMPLAGVVREEKNIEISLVFASVLSHEVVLEVFERKSLPSEMDSLDILLPQIADLPEV